MPVLTGHVRKLHRWSDLSRTALLASAVRLSKISTSSTGPGQTLFERACERSGQALSLFEILILTSCTFARPFILVVDWLRHSPSIAAHHTFSRPQESSSQERLPSANKLYWRALGV